jgi:hypothetical protein
MSNPQADGPASDRPGLGWLEIWGAPGLVILTAGGLILVAWFLWRTTNPKAQGQPWRLWEWWPPISSKKRRNW